MSNLACPFERSAERISRYKKVFLRLALRDDNFDADERAFHDELNEEINILNLASARRKLARHLDQIDSVTEYSHRLAQAADLGIIDLDEERRKRPGANVIELRPRHSAG